MLNAPTLVSEYPILLAEAFVVPKIGRYELLVRGFLKGREIFFENMGIRNVVAGYKTQDMGKTFRNIVCNHLLFCGLYVKVGAIATKRLILSVHEVEKLLYVQVAVELSITRNYHS